jgi:hypothetical protein
LCDFRSADDAHYGYTDFERRLYPTAAKLAVPCALRRCPRHDLLYVSPIVTGRELRAKGWTCAIVPAAEIDDRHRMTSALAEKRPKRFVC